ncbi:MAG: hypothetical protein LBN39_12520, partial [Planctomycetaceae bacterium]|nr:hypothetical protein [Planctomycetaceae bacterium]
MTTSNTTARKNNARSLRIENLENREMLSVNPFTPPLAAESPVEQIAVPEIQAAETLTALKNVTLTINAANVGSYDFSKVVSVTNSTITVQGVTLDFSNCTELVNTNLTASGGGVMRFPKLLVYQTTTNS